MLLLERQMRVERWLALSADNKLLVYGNVNIVTFPLETSGRTPPKSHHLRLGFEALPQTKDSEGDIYQTVRLDVLSK